VIRSMAVAVAGWAVGLGAMWAAKWALAWLLVDRQRIVDSVRNQISFRTSGEYEGVTGTRLTGFTKNLSYWVDRPLTPLVIAAAVVIVGTVAWRHRHRLDWPGVAWIGAAMVAIALPVISWFVALNNHNQIHFWLTYRSVAIAFGAVTAVAVVAIATYGDDRSPVRYAVDNGDDEDITSEPSEEQDVTPQAIWR
jgi:hypothetical protein